MSFGGLWGLGGHADEKNGSEDADEEELKPNKVKILDLEVMSIEALGDYVVHLQSEIKRVQAEIILKTKARRGAENIFK